MSSWILILFQMLLSKFVRMLYSIIAAKAPVAAEAPTAAEAPIASADVSLPIHSRDEASPEFTKELELTVHRGEDPVQSAPLLEVRKVVPEGQAPSPSLAAFNKSFGTTTKICGLYDKAKLSCKVRELS
jgi:hypothetical protein